MGSDCKTMQKLHPEMHVRCPGDPKIDKNKKVMKSDESNSDSSNKLEFGNDIDKALSSI